MSDRKFIRYALKRKAERMGVKASRYVAREFDKIQVEKYGRVCRRINQAKGTHKRETWKNRIVIEPVKGERVKEV